MEVRSGKASDVSQIISLFKILDLKHIENQTDFRYSPNIKRYYELMEACLKDQNYCLSISEIDGILIGFGIGRLKNIINHPYLIDKKVGEILHLIIDEEYRLKGYAKNILDDLEEKLKLRGAERFEMKVYNFNKEACPEKANYERKYSIYEKLIN